jgi:hypothetical protein
MAAADLPWANESSQILESLWVELRVLVLGPGESSKAEWFAKRQDIIKAIRDASEQRDTVLTCEEVFRQQAEPPVEKGYAELAHVDRADVVVALIVASPSEQGGVYRELEIIAPYPQFRRKVVIFLPSQKSYLERFQAGMLQVYREEQKVQMDWATLMECKQLRQICIGKVAEERKQRMYDAFFAKMRSRGG